MLSFRLKNGKNVVDTTFNTVSQCAIKNEEKIEKLKTFDLSLFFGKNSLGGDGFQNIFVYQPTFNMLELKEGKGTYYVIVCKSKGVYNFKLMSLHTAFLHNILSGYKIQIQLMKTF